MKSPRLIPFLIALAFGVITAAYTYFSEQKALETPIAALERKVLDFKFTLRGRVPSEPKVVIAAGDEKTIGAWGRWGTWDRHRYQVVLEHLFAAKADVVAFDMVFADAVGIDHDNTANIGQLLGQAQLSESAGSLAVALDENKRVDPAALARVAMAAKAIEDAYQQSIAGDARLKQAFDDYTSQVVQGFIANPNPDEGTPIAHGKEELDKLEPFVLKEYGYGYEITELNEGAASKGAESRVVKLKVKEGGKASDLKRVKAVQGNLVLPIPQFLDVASNLGFFSADPDPDGVMRKLPLVYRVGDVFLPSLSLSAASLHFGSTPVLIADNLFGDGLARIGFPAEDGGLKEVPVDLSGALLINYYGPAGPAGAEIPADRRGTFKRVSLADVYDDNFDKEAVKGKIILVAVTAIGTFDQRVTPFSAIAPGTEIHAAAIQNMLDGQALQRPELHLQLEMLLAIAIALLLALVIPRVSVTASVGIMVLAMASWAGIDVLVLFHRSLWFHQVPLQMEIALCWGGLTVWGYLTQGREKAQLKKEFSTVLAPTVVERLLEDPALAGLGGTEREMTVMFSDIRGFTSMSEKLTPEGLTAFLNEYLTPMTDILIRREGTLDKYMGDAIMAFWGAPIEQKDHAQRAALCALDMLERLEEMQRRWHAENKPVLEIGIGLNSGLMRVGFMGSARMRSYTVLGDNVNLGSRLEGTNKSYGTKVIVSETTYKAAADVVYGRWLDAVRVKGKREPVNIYELLGRREAPGARPPPQLAKLIDVFEAALRHYRAKQWNEAEFAFREAIKLRDGKDAASEVYLERIAHFRVEPPPDPWDGVYELKTK